MKFKFKFSKKILSAIGISLAGSFVIFCLILTVIPHSSENVIDVTKNTVRLRVVANSDTERDQALKLAVRDGIIGKAHDIFSECRSVAEAEAKISENMGMLELEAEKILSENGCNLPVNVRMIKEDVPVRRYSDYTFPAGVYETLRIDIGSASGQNWWCVMYPPLCLSAATGDVYAETAVFKEHGFTDKQIEELKKPERKVRFALFEWLF